MPTIGKRTRAGMLLETQVRRFLASCIWLNYYPARLPIIPKRCLPIEHVFKGDVTMLKTLAEQKSVRISVAPLHFRDYTFLLCTVGLNLST